MQPVKPGKIINIGLFFVSIPSYWIQSKHTPLFPIYFLLTFILCFGTIFVRDKLINWRGVIGNKKLGMNFNEDIFDFLIISPIGEFFVYIISVVEVILW
jgi:hypothetical protein